MRKLVRLLQTVSATQGESLGAAGKKGKRVVLGYFANSLARISAAVLSAVHFIDERDWASLRRHLSCLVYMPNPKKTNRTDNFYCFHIYVIFRVHLIFAVLRPGNCSHCQCECSSCCEVYTGMFPQFSTRASFKGKEQKVLGEALLCSFP